jgi:hypothetical protein
MKYLLASVLMLASTLPLMADEASKAQKIEELLVLTKADKMIDQVFDQINNAVMTQMSSPAMPADMDPQRKQMALDVQKQLMDLLRRKLAWDKMKPQYVRIYSESFSEEEVSAMVSFYRTPAGKSMLEKLPMVMAKSMELVQPMMKDIMPEIQRIVEAAAEKNGIKP